MADDTNQDPDEELEVDDEIEEVEEVDLDEEDLDDDDVAIDPDLDDDDVVVVDDVEADLDKILKDRMVTVDEEVDEDEEDDEADVRGEGSERLLPKQQDEQLCPSCFLLVRASAPNCPVGDDDCPIFS